METRERNKLLAAEKEAMQNCEKEEIHRLNEILPFGYLIAFDTHLNHVTHASENCTEWFGKPIDAILNAKLDALFSREIVHACNNAMGHSTISTQREYVGRVESGDSVCDAFAHMKGQHFIIELQPKIGAGISGLKILDQVHHAVERVEQNNSLQQLLERAVEELRFISGFHRVKAYKFLPDGAGEVVAESREAHVDSFLGLRFPAYDIPEAARKLYTTTPIRVIPSVAADQIKIRTTENEQPPLDLSLALLRGVVPVHTLYLKNMGVNATLSLPIVIDGKMWGLFALHHMEERMPGSEVLAALEILGGSLSMLISAVIRQFYLVNIRNCTKVVSSLFVPDESPLGFSTYWREAGPKLQSLIKCDGIALLSSDSLRTYGECMPEDATRQLTEYLDDEHISDAHDQTPIAIDSINLKYPEIECGNIVGVLAIPHPAPSYSYIYFFRKAVEDKIKWAGKPTKDVEQVGESFRLNPRGSFEAYIDSNLKKSDAYDEADMSIAKALIESLATILASVSVQKENRQRLGLVIRELNHRVRNTMALVTSIISQSRDTSHNLEEFIDKLESRIQSLSEAQKLLTDHEWRPVNIGELFDKAMNIYNDFAQRWVIIRGQELALSPNLVSLLTLVIHELSSNAIKYGALSNSTGHIEIKWYCTESDLVIHWKEIGGPKVEIPSRIGFGTSLIKEALAYEFDATCNINYLPKGLEVEFLIPLSHMNAIDSPIEMSNTKISPKSDQVANQFVALVLEDDYMISKELVQNLKEFGASTVDAVSTVENAISLIENRKYDFAILDVNIRGQYSLGVAKILNRKKVPFAFVTGYGSKAQELQDIDCVAILTKPVNKAELKDMFFASIY